MGEIYQELFPMYYKQSAVLKICLLNLLAISQSWLLISEALRARGRLCTTEPLLLKVPLLKKSFLLMEAVDRLKVSVTVVEDRRKNLEDPRM